MGIPAFLFLITGVLLNAAAQLLLKAGTNRARRLRVHRSTTAVASCVQASRRSPPILGGRAATS